METTAEQRNWTRDAVIAALERVAQVASERGERAAAERARGIISRLQADLFNLAVVGQFKRGKTTLINALLGRNLLPAAVVPLTSVVTVIEYGGQEEAVVHFLDGSQRAISFDELGDYVTERGNPGNRKKVSGATVRVPCPLLQSGLRVIDTPGVGSVHVHNTEAAYSFIPHVDGAVFLVTADPPISQAEVQFLRDLHGEVKRIFFVQNKADQVPEEEREESLEFSRAQLAQAMERDQITVFSLSAKEALEAKMSGDEARLAASGFPAFEQSLAEFARAEKSEAALEAALSTAAVLLQQQRAAIAVERSVLTMPLDELEEKRARFEAYLRQLRQARDDNRYLLRAAGERLVHEVVDRDLAELQKRKLPGLLSGLEQTARENEHLSGRALLDKLNAYTRASLEAVYREWVAEEEKRVTEALQQAIARFNSQINAALRDLARISSELFHADVGDLTVTAALSGPREFFFAPWQMQVSPDILAGSLLHLLPGRWVRRRLLAAVRAKLAEQLDMHGGRMRYDFVRRLQSSLRRYESGIIEAMDATIAGIEDAIQRAIEQRRAAAEGISTRREELAAQESSLLSASAELERPTAPQTGAG